MEEQLGAQYAIQIAVHTLRERCRTLQQRIAELEEENVNLRMTCVQRSNENKSLSEIDKLTQQVAEISEQKLQLQNTIEMVTQENKDLWRKLGKLTKANHSLGSQLNKINDTLSNHTTSNLIRSKTFTQIEPKTKRLQMNLEENDRVSLELENISLKLIESFSKEKEELQALCSEIKDLQGGSIVTENFAFYNDDIDGDLFNDFVGMLEELKELKQSALTHQELIRQFSQTFKDQMDKSCDVVDKGTSIEVSDFVISTDEPEESNSELQVDKICPVCSKHYFKNSSFEEFQQHVEEHFTEGYEIL